MAATKQSKADLFEKAMLLPDNDLLIVKYEITSQNIGKLQLSNSILLSDRNKKNLKEILRIVELYITDTFVVPKQNSKP
jgi:hypothetical protein